MELDINGKGIRTEEELEERIIRSCEKPAVA